MKPLALIGAVLLAASAVQPAAASHPARVTADLNGRPIPVAEVGKHYCYDRDFPAIHCYSTADGLESARSSAAGLEPAAAQSTDFVIVYSGQTYSGNYFYISQNYDMLAVAGWNDRIRSYRVLNGSSGHYYTDWFGSGAVQSFCCNSAIPYLSATFDAQFSSVYRS
jgi:hypothetical protein